MRTEAKKLKQEKREEEDDKEFEEKMEWLTSELAGQFKKSKELETDIRKNLEGLGYGI